MRRITFAALTLAAACTQQSESEPTAPASLAEAAAQRLPLEPCTLDRVEEQLLCGSLDVPLRRDRSDSATIAIPVIVVPAANGNPDGRAFIEHGGGPGHPTTGLTRFYTDGRAGDMFRQNRDIVIVDQRGVGRSSELSCDALDTMRFLEPYFTEETVRACRDEMTARGVDLAAYSTVEAVADFDAIREWLGYEQFDVGGWSYGSRFMLTYAHFYPQSIRSLMVFLPTTIDYHRPLDWARFTEAAMQGVFDDCAAEASCAEAFPDLHVEFQQVLDVLDAAPVATEILNPATGEREPRSITRGRWIEGMHVALLKVRSSRYLPLVIHSAAHGDFEPFVLLTVPDYNPPTPPEALYLSIVCPEETAFFSADEATAAASGSFVGTHFSEEFKMACAIWNLPAHPAFPLNWARPDIPALVIAGGRDPITPIEYGEAIAAAFDNARLITVPKMPHDSTGLDNSGCLDGIILAFLESADPQSLDTSCVSDMRPALFAIEAPKE